MSASKTFNIAGLNTSYEIVPNPVLREKMLREKTASGIGHPNLFGVIALESAYRHCEKWLDELVGYPERKPGVAHRACPSYGVR